MTTAAKPKIAVIGTGGTISSIARDSIDVVDYVSNDLMLHIDGVIDLFPEVHEVAEVIAVPFRAIPSPHIDFPDWRELVLKMDELVANDPDLAGIVITHGTASLEETAYVLHLTAKVEVPVVLVGSQRPASAMGTDAGRNLFNAIRTAAAPDARGLGVLTLLNDEIQSAREVTKTSNFRMQTFRSPDFGCLGHADGDEIVFYRKPVRQGAPNTEFDIRDMTGLPRVDIVYSYCGSDGTAARAFIEAGAKGIVSAGFAPGFMSPADEAVLKEAAAAGVIVVQSSRAGSGRAALGTKLREPGNLAADNLNPQKARILLSLALSVTDDPAEIKRMFGQY